MQLVDPRMAELSEAKAILNDSQVQLQAKQTEHQAIVSQLTELESQHASTNEECDQLKQDVAKATERFSRAKYILECLQDETGRWDAAANEASASLQYAVGDYLLVAAGLVYSGVLNANYRSLLFKQWVKVCTVPVKSDFDFTKLLESLNTVSVYYVHCMAILSMFLLLGWRLNMYLLWPVFGSMLTYKAFHNSEHIDSWHNMSMPGMVFPFG